MTHPAQRLDDAVHQRTRLGILAVLCEAGSADFVHLRTVLELTDGNLSRNLQRLQESGYISVEKGTSGRRRTILTPTTAGRTALDAELEALKELIRCIETPATSLPGLRLTPHAT